MMNAHQPAVHGWIRIYEIFGFDPYMANQMRVTCAREEGRHPAIELLVLIYQRHCERLDKR